MPKGADPAAKSSSDAPKSAAPKTKHSAKSEKPAASEKPVKAAKAVVPTKAKAAKKPKAANPLSATTVERIMKAAMSGTAPKPKVAPPPHNPAFSEAMVFYADMLGFSHQVKAAGSTGADALLKILKRFAEQFTEDEQSHAFFGRKYWAISDSMVAVWDMKSKAVDVMTEFDAILSQLHHVAGAQGAMMVDDRQLVRGGVARGWFKEVDNTIVSPALVDAARIEEKIENPFIGVAPDIYEHFLKHSGRKAYAEDIDPMNDLFIAPCAYTNGLPALDYFAAVIGDIDLNATQLRHSLTLPSGPVRQAYLDTCYNGNVRLYIDAHRQFIVDGLETQTGKVLNKYEALRDHHNFWIDRRFKDKTLLIPRKAQ